MEIMRYEMKKIVKKKMFLVACIFVLLIEGIYTISPVLNFEYETVDDILSGREGIEAYRAEQQSIRGRLDDEYLIRVYETYHEIVSNPDNISVSGDMTDKVYIEKWMKYNKIETLVIKNYSDIDGSIDVTIMDKLSKDQILSFYDQWEKRVLRMNQVYPSADIDADIDINSDINADVGTGEDAGVMSGEGNRLKAKDRLALDVISPFYMDYHLGYTIFFQNSGVMITILSLLSAIFLVPIFAYEYASGAHLLIATSQRGRKDICLAKYKAAYIVGTLFYWIAMGAFLLMIKMLYSLVGGHTSIQFIFLDSPYRLTTMQGLVITLLVGYVAYMAFVGLALTISILTKKMSVALCLSLALLLLPQIISGSDNSIVQWLSKLSFTGLMDGHQVLIMHQGITIAGQWVLPVILLQMILVGFITAGALMIGKKVYCD